MFHTCSTFLSLPLEHSLPENQIAALKGKGNSPKLTKKATEKIHTVFPTDHTASRGPKFLLASVHSPSYTSQLA